MAGVLLGQWGFLDNLSDTSGNGHTATANFTPTYIAGPHPGSKGVQLASATSTITYGRTGLEPAAAAGGVVSMAWVKTSALPVDANIFYPILHHQRDLSGSTRAGFMLRNGGSGTMFRPLARWRDQLAFSDGIGPVLSDGNWHHLCVVDSDDRYQWYVDGVSVGTAARSNTTTAVTWEAFDWHTGDNAYANEKADPGIAVSGVRLFSGSLTTTEVNTWMNTPIVNYRRLGGITAEAMVSSPTPSRRLGSITTEALVAGASNNQRQLGNLVVEVLIPTSGATLDYGITGAGFPTTGLLVKGPDGNWRAVRKN